MPSEAEMEKVFSRLVKREILDTYKRLLGLSRFLVLDWWMIKLGIKKVTVRFRK